MRYSKRSFNSRLNKLRQKHGTWKKVAAVLLVSNASLYRYRKGQIPERGAKFTRIKTQMGYESARRGRQEIASAEKVLKRKPRTAQIQQRIDKKKVNYYEADFSGGNEANRFYHIYDKLLDGKVIDNGLKRDIILDGREIIKKRIVTDAKLVDERGEEFASVRVVGMLVEDSSIISDEVNSTDDRDSSWFHYVLLPALKDRIIKNARGFSVNGQWYGTYGKRYKRARTKFYYSFA